MEHFPHVFQRSANDIRNGFRFDMKGKWKTDFFNNNHPIILELGCGKGEYTVGQAEMFPDKNFIGVDIKGARIWTGAKDALEKKLNNVAFIRTNIELIHTFFATDEVDEIWLTFPDPQMKKTTKRLTATNFMQIYRQFLIPGGIIHLKTDSHFMFTYTKELTKRNNYPIRFSTDDLYASEHKNPVFDIKTYYEQQWIERGLTIKLIEFSLEKDATFTEPDIEPEQDAYRSFGRSKRQHLT
jgi:tRNA (guanine-N7-)-methyltransferase